MSAMPEPKRIKITKPIVGFSVARANQQAKHDPKPETPGPLDVELPKRTPGPLAGVTYKIKNPASDEPAIYITVNFTRVKTEKGSANRLAEIFIRGNGKDDLQYVTFTAKMLSALFRKTGRIRFIIDEMIQTPCETGGYRAFLSENDERPRFFKSQIAHMGAAIEDACKRFGILDMDGFLIEQHGDAQAPMPELDLTESAQAERAMREHEAASTIPGGLDCPECGGIGTVRYEGGCDRCVNCGHSKKCE